MIHLRFDFHLKGVEINAIGAILHACGSVTMVIFFAPSFTHERRCEKNTLLEITAFCENFFGS